MAVCRCCGENFSREKGWRRYCSSKCRHKNRRLKAYGITLADLNDCLLKQNNRCAICKKDFDKLDSHAINVDHNHQTGKFRGLLCLNCNQGLGQFKDSVGNLISAVEYLERT